MHEQEKYLIAKLYSLAHNVSIPEAYDIVRETQYQINDFLSGEIPTYYNDLEEVIADYLDLGPSYLYIFL